MSSFGCALVMLCLSRFMFCSIGEAPVEKGTSAALTLQWEKMSKSKHNGVDPQVRCSLLRTNSRSTGRILTGVVIKLLLIS